LRIISIWRIKKESRARGISDPRILRKSSIKVWERELASTNIFHLSFEGAHSFKILTEEISGWL